VRFPGRSLLSPGVGRLRPHRKDAALRAIHGSHETGEILTGILYVDPAKARHQGLLGMVEERCTLLPMERLRPPREALDAIMESIAGCGPLQRASSASSGGSSSSS